MRSVNSIKNIIWAMIVFVINLAVNFIARKYFIVYLGIEFNGLNGLFSSILSMLSIAELGISSAIVFNLYKPISDGDTEQINSLLHFYKKSYNIIAIVIFGISMLIMPFLNIIVGENTLDININIAFFIFVLDVVFSYLLSYKRSIFIASQNERAIKKIHLAYIVVYNIFQIIFLHYTHNFYIYLIIKLIFTIIENVVISNLANKKYPYIKNKAQKIDKKTKDDIIKKIKALFIHKIAGFIVNGTDNILISSFFGVIVVGYYNNYYLVISSLISLIYTIFSTITASVGNLLVTANSEDSYIVYKRIYLLNEIIATVSFIAFAVCIQPFIKIWLGENFLFSFDIIIVMAYYYYFRVIKYSASTFKDAAGIYYEDRFVPIIESIVNIIFSLLFINMFGVSGILIGTIVSNFVLHIYSYPKYVYKKLFKKEYSQYYGQLIFSILNASLCLLISYFICNITTVNNSYVEIIKNFVITVFIVLIDFLIIKGKSDEFKYYIKFLEKFLKKEKIKK